MWQREEVQEMLHALTAIKLILQTMKAARSASNVKDYTASALVGVFSRFGNFSIASTWLSRLVCVYTSNDWFNPCMSIYPWIMDILFSRAACGASSAGKTRRASAAAK
jgi:hypothetical protein